MRITYIIIAMVVAAVVLGGIYFWRGGVTSSPAAGGTAGNSAEEKASVSAINASAPQAPTANMPDKVRAVMKTNLGDITLELFPKDAPKTVENFIKLAQAGFYDGVKFHRVIKGFMIQSGDPNSKDDDWSNDGMGGPGYVFKDEINSHKVVRGALAMANAGPNTNGSQFFIVTADAASWLDGKHTVFGRVSAGMDVADKIENTPVDRARDDHPVRDIVINAIEIN